MVDFNKLRTFTVFSLCARPFTEIRVVDVQKLTTSAVRARPFAEIGVVDDAKTTEDFLQFLTFPRDPAQIGVVEALSLLRRANLQSAR